MQIFNSILAIFYREYKITFNNFQDIFTILIFFILGILIFVFSIGPNKEIFNYISVGIIWTLLLLSTNLSIDKFYKNNLFRDLPTLLKLRNKKYDVCVEFDHSVIPHSIVRLRIIKPKKIISVVKETPGTSDFNSSINSRYSSTV